jgi:ABC-type phosphate transport system substrate-binding protein
VLSVASATAAVAFPVPVIWDGSTTLFPFVSAASGSTQAPATYPYANFLQRNATEFGSNTGRCNLVWGNIDVATSSGSIASTDNTYTGSTAYGIVTGATNAPGGSPQAPVVAATACDNASVTHTGTPPFNNGQEQDWVVAHDGVIMIVNPDLAPFVTNLTRTQIEQIYSCSVTNWSVLIPGAPNQTIVPISRDTASGTWSTFTGFLSSFGLTTSGGTGGGGNEGDCQATTGQSRATGNPNVDTDIQTIPWSIGYVGLGFDGSVVSGVTNVNLETIAPTSANITGGSYAFARFLHLVTLQYGVSPSVALGTYSGAIDFVNYMLSSGGQGDVGSAGFIPMTTPTVIPDYDVNVDNVVNVTDLSLVGQAWLTTGLHHWIRQDVTRAGVVNVNSLSTVGQHWLTSWSVSTN